MKTQNLSHKTIRTPGLVDTHIHPDKTSWGQSWTSRRPAETLFDLINNDLKMQSEYTSSVEERSYALMSNAVKNGTFAMRAHVDVSSELGLKNIEGVRAAAERLSPSLDVQIVAFPQFGLLTNPGTLQLMESSLTSGADIVGGIDPLGLEEDMDGHLDAVFGLSQKFGRELDIHLHDEGEAGLLQIREIAARTIALGMQGKVTIGHAFALCDEELPSLKETLDAVAEAGVWIATCALGTDPVPNPHLFTKHGVKLTLGSDGVRDAWSPFGTASMVDRAHLFGYRTGALTDEELEHGYNLASFAGGEMLGVEDITEFETANPKSYLEFSGENLAQIVIDRPAPLRIVRN